LIYFITQKDRKYIKIGYTNQTIKQRFSNLQVGNPQTLIVIDIIEGGEDYERRLHKLFHKDHERGEWYRFTEDIASFIKASQDHMRTNHTQRKPRDISKMSLDEMLKYMVDIGMVDRPGHRLR